MLCADLAIGKFRKSHVGTCSDGKLGEGNKLAGAAKGGLPEDPKGVWPVSVGDGGEIRTTSRLQLFRRKPDDVLCRPSASISTYMSIWHDLSQRYLVNTWQLPSTFVNTLSNASQLLYITA